MSELEIKNNKVICECGKDLGGFEEGKVFFCKKCFVSGWWPITYGVKVSFEDIFGNESLKRSGKIE